MTRLSCSRGINVKADGPRLGPSRYIEVDAATAEAFGGFVTVRGGGKWRRITSADFIFRSPDVKKGMAPAIRLLFATGVDLRLDYLSSVRGVEDVALQRRAVSLVREAKP